MTPDFFQTVNGQQFFHIGSIFLLYVAVSICFAFLYFIMFKRDPSLFVFASDVAKGQLASKISQTRIHLDNLLRAEQILSSASAHLEKKPEEKIDRSWTLEIDGGSIACVMVFVGGAIGGGSYPAIEVRGVENREALWRWAAGFKIFKGYSTAVLLKEIVQQRAIIRTQIGESQSLFASLAPGSPEIWSFADFFYFSVIIQSTVGLGDIQPNSTVIRMIVISQILLGYAILVVLLNVLLSWH